MPVQSHNYLNLNQAAAVCPNSPRPGEKSNNLHSSTIWRWCRKGVKATSGDMVKLRHVRIGGKIHTTKQWLDDFFESLAAADMDHFDREPVKTGTLSASRRRHERDDAELVQRLGAAS